MDVTIKLLGVFAVIVVVGAITVFSFGAMLLAMNGYSESDAEWGIYLFLAMAIAVAIATCVLSVLGTIFLNRKKELNIFAASAISVVVCCILGAVGNIAGIFLGIGMAELVRTGF